jgi:uncharacterized membrane protein (DUF2068 family)
MARELTASKCTIFAVNVAIVVYLIYRIRRKEQA